ncbi:hypothetical protein CPB97_002492 [Podila verticillata]|nr:hypothetical protein CPB97_002492 [Podila verticillata]
MLRLQSSLLVTRIAMHLPWVHAKLQDFTMPKPLSVALCALLTSQLKNVAIFQGDLAAILCWAENLRRFSALTTSPEESLKDRRVSAENLISVEWRVPDLQMLLCKLKVPRSDHHVPAKEVDGTLDHPSINLCYSVKTDLLHQVSWQRNLETLTFGNRAQTSPDLFQWYLPEITLQCDLTELSSLTNV